jgi:hypothetical protein
MDEDEIDESLLKSGRQKSSVDTKTVIIGGGILAAIIFLLFRRGSGGGDKKRLLFKLRANGLWLGDKLYNTATEAIARIKAGGRNDVELQAAGDVPQGAVDALTAAFQAGGIVVYQHKPQSFYSVYQKGLGGNIA